MIIGLSNAIIKSKKVIKHGTSFMILNIVAIYFSNFSIVYLRYKRLDSKRNFKYLLFVWVSIIITLSAAPILLSYSRVTIKQH